MISIPHWMVHVLQLTHHHHPKSTLSIRFTPGVVQSVGLDKSMTTHSSILAWNIPWTEEPVGPQSLGLQKVRHDLVNKHAYNDMYPSL